MTTFTGVLLGLALACTGDDTDDPPDISTTKDSAICGGTTPVADSLLIYNGGSVNFEGEDAPTIALELHLTDEDGDLYQGTYEVWYDAVLDDTVDTSGDPATDRTFSQVGEPCETDQATLRLNIRVGTVFEYNTVYEFAARFIDADGLPSNTLVEAGVTPKEDFSDGDWPEDDSGL